jgi:multidrug efflux pump subunit AcrA (membrane-fusion protein)
MRRLRNAVIIGGLYCLGLAMATGCATTSSSALPTPTPWPTPVVVQQTTYTVQRGTVVDHFMLDGRVSPIEWEPLFYKVDGKLTVLNATEGAGVRKGDVLAELDTKVLNDQLSQAMLSLEQMQSQAEQQDASRKYALERARVTLKIQELALERLRRSIQETGPLQRAQAEKDLERTKVNLDRAQAAYNAVANRPDVAALSQSAALQTATIEYQLAEIKYRLATQGGDSDIQLATQELQVQLARINVQELEERAQASASNDVVKATLQVEALQRQIDERKLRAPYDGLIAAIGINVQGLTRGFAQRPKVGDNIPAYAALVVIAKPTPLEITVDGTQKRVSELFIGQTVTVTHSSWAHPFTSQITGLPVTMSASGNQPTGSQAVRIAIPANAPPMANGDPVQITVKAAEHTDVLFLHPAGVRRFAGRAFVLVQEGERQRRVDITIGLENDQQVEIVSGLREGDVVASP